MMGEMTAKDMLRFESKYTKGDTKECWLWMYGLNRNGYGKFKLKTKSYGAHRLMYLLYNGTIPDKMYVCHSCDNRKCVNPGHLWLGTASDNMKDMHKKGRAPNKGDTHWKARLKAEDIPVIRELSAAGARNVDMATKFHVDKCTIAHVLSGRTWAHI